eukprot:3241196-Rhodomonas_salina.1
MKLFHLPLDEAAEAIGICSTALKNVCRKLGVSRWPYRRVRRSERKREIARQYREALRLRRQAGK